MNRLSRSIIILFVFLLTCCNNSSISSTGEKSNSSSIDELTQGTSIDKQELKRAIFIASHYIDYYENESIEKRKSQLLLDGNHWFFNYLTYNLKKPLAGDIFTISYYGEMYFIETDPGDIILNGEIVDVTQELAGVVKCVVSIDQDGRRYVNSINDDVSFNNKYFEGSIDRDSYFHNQSTLSEGTILYATYNYQHDKIYFYSFYDYDVTIR